MFTDEEAKEAPVLFKKLGLLYLTAKMPPWMRLKLGGGALTPISKEQFALGGDPDARPVKTEDFDTSAWIKALARTVASTVCDTVQPQQLGVGVSGGVETLVLGLRLWFEKQVANGVTAVAVSVDPKNAHNSFSRTKCM